MSEINRVAHFTRKLSGNLADTSDRAQSSDWCPKKHDCCDDCCDDDCCDDCKHDDCKHDKCCPVRGIGFVDILLSLKDISK